MKRTLIASIVIASFSSIAIAQTSTEQKPITPVVGHVQLGIDVTSFDWIAVGYRASKLLKSDVYNDQNKKVGKIADLIVKPDGTINVAIVEVGGFLGIDTHHVAIPVNQFTSVAPKIVLPGATKESLKGLPEFKYAR
jgi:sporulation protein YlmC with PRC-barrel domain